MSLLGAETLSDLLRLSSVISTLYEEWRWGVGGGLVTDLLTQWKVKRRLSRLALKYNCGMIILPG